MAPLLTLLLLAGLAGWAEAQVLQLTKPGKTSSLLVQRPFAELTSNQSDPADAICQRSPVGAVVTDPVVLTSQNGVLQVTFQYQTAVDEAGLTRYCYVYADASGNLQESPTLEVNPGDQLIIHFTNNLPSASTASVAAHAMYSMKMQPAASAADAACSATSVTSASTNLHFHGTNTAPVCHQDEVVHTLIQPQEEFDYTVQIPPNEPPGAYWYHPHPHGFSDTQVLGGASGVIIVEGIENANPVVAGLPQRVLVLRDQALPASDSAQPGNPIPKTDISINYVPILYPSYTPAVIQTGPSEQEFWRVLNTSADTLLNIAVIDNGQAQTMQIVAVDGVPLTDSNGNPTTTAATSYVLSSASRVEFIVTTPAVGDTTAQFVSQTWDNGPVGDADPGRPIANIVSSTSTSPATAVRRIPARTHAQAVTRFMAMDATPPVTQRTLYFSLNLALTPAQFYITVDGQTPAVFNMDGPPNITVTEGTVEQWTIQNRSQMDHNFHIHQLHFQTLAINGVAVNDTTRRDTIDIPYWSGNPTDPYPSVTLLMDFRDPNIVGTFVYHCHVLSHEDLGMMGMIQVLPGVTNTTLAISPGTTFPLGTSVTLTATVAPAAGTGTPTGTVSFQNGSSSLGTATLNSAGVATLSTTSLPIGSGTISALYSGDNSFATSTSTAVAVVVTAAATTTALTASPTTVVTGANVALTATVTAPAGTGTPSGNVNFLNGATVVGTAALNASGIATLSTTTLPVGSLSITAVYAGSASFGGSTSAPVTVTVKPTPTMTVLTASPGKVLSGASVALAATVTASGAGTPAGNVSFLNGGTAVGTAAVNASGIATLSTTTLPIGSLSITAVYAGSASFGGSTSAPVTVTVQPTPTMTVLTASPGKVLSGASVALTATVTASGAGAPTGNVSFLNGGAAVGTAAVNASGIATLSTTALPVGSLSITAVYAGGATFASSTSAAVTVIIQPLPPDFGIAVSPASLALAPGGTGTSTVTITPLNAFNNGVTFTCSGLPSESMCTFNPASVAPNGTSPTTTTASVSTTAASAAVVHPRIRHSDVPLYALVLPGLGTLLGLGRLRKRLGGGRIALLAVALVLALGIDACGSGSTTPSNPGTPPGASTITITATSGSIVHTATLALTVSQ